MIGMFKVSFEPPKFGVAQEVKNLLKAPPKSKKNNLVFWSRKERAIVGSILILSVLFSIYFWYKGNNQIPDIQLPKIENFGFGFSEVIEVK